MSQKKLQQSPLSFFENEFEPTQDSISFIMFNDITVKNFLIPALIVFNILPFICFYLMSLVTGENYFKSFSFLGYTIQFIFCSLIGIISFVYYSSNSKSLKKKQMIFNIKKELENITNKEEIFKKIEKAKTFITKASKKYEEIKTYEKINDIITNVETILFNNKQTLDDLSAFSETIFNPFLNLDYFSKMTDNALYEYRLGLIHILNENYSSDILFGPNMRQIIAKYEMS